AQTPADRAGHGLRRRPARAPLGARPCRVRKRPLEPGWSAQAPAPAIELELQARRALTQPTRSCPMDSHAPQNFTLNARTVLITGGTGSFGTRFAATVLKRYQAKRVIVYSRDELKQFEMQQREPFRSNHDTMRWFIG